MIFDGMIKQIKDSKIYDEMDYFRRKTRLVINSQQELPVFIHIFLTFIFEI